MKRRRDFEGTVFLAPLIIFLMIGSINTAYAYIDPGTGSMLVQMALAGIAGALFYFRQLRLAATDWFRRVILRQAPVVEDSAGSKSSVSSTSP